MYAIERIVLRCKNIVQDIFIIFSITPMFILRFEFWESLEDTNMHKIPRQSST